MMQRMSMFVAVLMFAGLASSYLAAVQTTGEFRQQEYGNVSQQTGASDAVRQPSGNDVGQYEHMFAREPVAPAFLASMTPEHINALGQLLDYWEKSSGRVERLTADFQRWDYDPEMCNWRDPGNRLGACRIVQGKIQYGAPDKADIKSTAVWNFGGLNPQTQEPNYEEDKSDTAGERWLCDGKAIFQYDFPGKKLLEIPIPDEMQGRALSNSPLPFLFGAKRADLEERFWMQIITPDGVQDEYWIEAWPKRRDDAGGYHHVEIILAREDFLPKSVHIYAANWDRVENPVEQHIEFSNRRVNDQLSNIRDFFNVFIRPRVPLGWELVKADMAGHTATEVPQVPAGASGGVRR